MFEVSTPRPSQSSASFPEGTITIRMEFSPSLGGNLTKRLMKAQEFIDSEVLRLCSPLVPFRNGALELSGTIHTKVGSGEVVYKTPYARRWYYEPANFNGAPTRGNRWFERMKAQSAGTILKGAEKILNND